MDLKLKFSYKYKAKQKINATFSATRSSCATSTNGRSRRGLTALGPGRLPWRCSCHYCLLFKSKSTVQVMGFIAVLVNCGLIGLSGPVHRIFPNITGNQTVISLHCDQLDKHKTWGPLDYQYNLSQDIRGWYAAIDQNNNDNILRWSW